MTRWERMAEHKGRGNQADIRNFFARRVGRPRKANGGFMQRGDLMAQESRGNMEKRDRIAGGFSDFLSGIPKSRLSGLRGREKAAGLLERLLVEKNI